MTYQFVHTNIESRLLPGIPDMVITRRNQRMTTLRRMNLLLVRLIVFTATQPMIHSSIHSVLIIHSLGGSVSQAEIHVAGKIMSGRLQSYDLSYPFSEHSASPYTS